MNSRLCMRLSGCMVQRTAFGSRRWASSARAAPLRAQKPLGVSLGFDTDLGTNPHSGHSRFRASPRTGGASTSDGSVVDPNVLHAAIDSSPTDEEALSLLAGSFTAPDSPAAYRRRLADGNFFSAAELLTAPYAPANAATILDDVVRSEHSANLSEFGIEELVLRCVDHVSEAEQAWKHSGDVASFEAYTNARASVSSVPTLFTDLAHSTPTLSGTRPRVALLKLLSLLGEWEVAVLTYSKVSASLSSSENSGEADQDLFVSALAYTMQACAPSGNFAVGLHLYREARYGPNSAAFVPLPEHFQALAAATRSKEHVSELREEFALVQQDLPVSLPLYEAMAEMCVCVRDEPDRQHMALAFLRGVKDAQIVPSQRLYAATIEVAASFGEATQAFALYHEAKAVHGTVSPDVCAGLVRAYVVAGKWTDAEQTVSTFVHCKIRLQRDAFHALLSGCDSSAKALKILSVMKGQDVPRNSCTYAFVVDAFSRCPDGNNTALLVSDALRDLLRDGLFPSDLFTLAMENALLSVTIDAKHVQFCAPLIGMIHHTMATYLGVHDSVFATTLPSRPVSDSDTVAPRVAVLAFDTLCNINVFSSIAGHFDRVIVPYTSLVQFRRSVRVDDDRCAAVAAFLAEHKGRVVVLGFEHDLAAAADHKAISKRRLKAVAFRALAHIPSLCRSLRVPKRRIYVATMHGPLRKELHRNHALDGVKVLDPSVPPSWEKPTAPRATQASTDDALARGSGTDPSIDDSSRLDAALLFELMSD